jgi:glycosyltransferase involved in cell wall biosynthesis
VVTSVATATAEVCGPAALLVDPDDPAALTEAVERAATDEHLRTTLREAGLRRAAGYSWERTAAQVDELLRGLAES